MLLSELVTDLTDHGLMVIEEEGATYSTDFDKNNWWSRPIKPQG